MLRFTVIAVAVALLSPAACPAQDFSYDSLLLGWMKLKGDDFDYEANAKSYLQLYRADTWAQVKDNEFKQRDEVKKTIDIMKRKVKDFDAGEEFTLNTKLTFDSYDFQTGVFPLGLSSKSPVTNKTYWYPNSPYPTGTLPNEMKVYFSNPEMLASFPMDKEAAEKFIDGRKDYQRQVNARVQFKLTKARESSGEVLAEVQAVTLHDAHGTKDLVLKAKKGEAKKGEKTAEPKKDK